MGYTYVTFGRVRDHVECVLAMLYAFDQPQKTSIYDI